jgi:hypothetical protein
MTFSFAGLAPPADSEPTARLCALLDNARVVDLASVVVTIEVPTYSLSKPPARGEPFQIIVHDGVATGYERVFFVAAGSDCEDGTVLDAQLKQTTSGVVYRVYETNNNLQNVASVEIIIDEDAVPGEIRVCYDQDGTQGGAFSIGENLELVPNFEFVRVQDDEVQPKFWTGMEALVIRLTGTSDAVAQSLHFVKATDICSNLNASLNQNQDSPSTANSDLYSVALSAGGELRSVEINLVTPGKYHICWQVDGALEPTRIGTFSVAAQQSGSGIVGDPHVHGSDGRFVDFFGDSGVYQLLETEAVRINAYLGFAEKSNKMLWHPSALKAGTIFKEVGILCGDTKIRVSTIGGGLVSINDAAGTRFLVAGEDYSGVVCGMDISWTSVDATKDFPWGSHRRSQKLEVQSKTEIVEIFAASSSGYDFVDVDYTVLSVEGEKQGLLHEASSRPEFVRDLITQGQEHKFKVASLDIFGSQTSPNLLG